MADLNISGLWDTLKGKVQETYSHLTNEDLQMAEGKEHELVARLQDKLGKTKDEVETMLTNFKNDHLKN